MVCDSGGGPATAEPSPTQLGRARSTVGRTAALLAFIRLLRSFVVDSIVRSFFHSFVRSFVRFALRAAAQYVVQCATETTLASSLVLLILLSSFFPVKGDVKQCALTNAALCDEYHGAP